MLAKLLLLIGVGRQAAPNMEAITASLERSLQNCSLNNNNNNQQNGRTRRRKDNTTDAAATRISSTTSSSSQHAINVPSLSS
jgi:hypothetical protein